jgi:hypothetical protein
MYAGALQRHGQRSPIAARVFWDEWADGPYLLVRPQRQVLVREYSAEHFVCMIITVSFIAYTITIPCTPFANIPCSSLTLFVNG